MTRQGVEKGRRKYAFNISRGVGVRCVPVLDIFFFCVTEAACRTEQKRERRRRGSATAVKPPFVLARRRTKTPAVFAAGLTCPRRF